MVRVTSVDLPLLRLYRNVFISSADCCYAWLYKKNAQHPACLTYRWRDDNKMLKNLTWCLIRVKVWVMWHEAYGSCSSRTLSHYYDTIPFTHGSKSGPDFVAYPAEDVKAALSQWCRAISSAWLKRVQGGAPFDGKQSPGSRRGI